MFWSLQTQNFAFENVDHVANLLVHTVCLGCQLKAEWATYGLYRKYSLQVHLSEHLVPRWQLYFGREGRA